MTKPQSPNSLLLQRGGYDVHPLSYSPQQQLQISPCVHVHVTEVGVRMENSLTMPYNFNSNRPLHRFSF